MNDPTVCVITDDIRRQERFEAAFANSIRLHFAENYQAAIPFVNKQLIGCVIVPVNITSSDDLVPITTLKNHCSPIPLIIYGKVVDEQLCVELGKIGIEAYFETDMMKELVAKVQGIIEQRKFKVEFSQFGIDVEQCPMTIRRALKMMEKDFLTIKSVTEIANKLHISLPHFEREFTRCCSISCKKLLIGLKLYCATYIMEKSGYASLKQIAKQCGFAEYKSFHRLFSQYAGINPTCYRQDHFSKQFPQIFIKNVTERNNNIKKSHQYQKMGLTKLENCLA